MTLCADPKTRITRYINYGITKLESAKSAFEFWQRRALAHTIEQIDADEELMRQALDALEDAHYKIEHLQDIILRSRTIDTLKERLK